MKKPLFRTATIEILKIDEATIHANDNGFQKYGETAVQDNDIFHVVAYVAHIHYFGQ